MPGNVMGGLAAARRMTDVDGISEVEMLDNSGDIRRVMFHVVTIAHLRRAAMAASVMGDNAIALSEEVEHLRIPIVCAERPTVVENDWLRAFRAPVLEKD